MSQTGVIIHPEGDGIVELKDIIPINVALHTGAATQWVFNTAVLEGCLMYLPNKTIFNRLVLHTGVSWSGTFTLRVCIYQSADGTITTSLNKILDETVANSAAGTDTTFTITPSGGDTTLERGFYILCVGRNSGTGSPFLQTLIVNDIDIHNNNLSGMPSTFSDLGSATSPPASVDPTGETSEVGGDVIILHKFRKV